MDLKDRLEKIERLKKSVQQIGSLQKDRDLSVSSRRRPVPIADVLSGNTADTPYGTCFFSEKTIPLETSFGEHLLAEIVPYFPFQSDFFRPKYHEKTTEIQLDEALFFDTETTGLAGGAGTYIFLLGLGYFTEDTFRIRQYFMSDYNEEEALLWSVNQLFAQNFKLLVSYNGRSYDYPLMQTRFIMTRQPMQLTDPCHLDLLFPVRRIWKRRLQDCSLANIERRVLKINREEDIPGYLIPHVYFRYLQDRDARPLKPVFEHNLQDIISLVILTAKISQVLKDPLQRDIYGLDLCGIGKFYEINRDYEYSTRCYEEALKGNLSDEDSLEVLKLCSFAYKKQEQWEKAEAAWRDILSLSRHFLSYPYEELAKYYEHRLRDYARALYIVEEALLHLEQSSLFPEQKEEWQKSFRYRLQRIKRKQQKN